MIKQAIISATALLSLGAFASSTEWVLNEKGVPFINEKNTTTKALALFDVCATEGDLPLLVLADDNIPPLFIGKQVNYKARVDRNGIWEVSSTYIELGDTHGVAMQMDPKAFKIILDGQNMRFQFPAQNGGNVVETYSLNGLTKTLADAIALCESDFFNEEPTEDEEFFSL